MKQELAAALSKGKPIVEEKTPSKDSTAKSTLAPNDDSDNE